MDVRGSRAAESIPAAEHGSVHPGPSRWPEIRASAAMYAVVGLGSAIGGTGRWLISMFWHPAAVADFPFAILLVNVGGSFMIGFYAALTAPEGRLFAGPRHRHFVMTGMCGGFTTFSIFSFESIRLMESGRLDAAGLFVGISVVGWLVAVWAGHALATYVNGSSTPSLKGRAAD